MAAARNMGANAKQTPDRVSCRQLDVWPRWETASVSGAQMISVEKKDDGRWSSSAGLRQAPNRLCQVIEW